MSGNDVDRATRAIRDGELVVYPTETVYGLGGDALNQEAVERVFEVKDRSFGEPLSIAVPTVERALSYVRVSGRERDFMHEFLPGPVTVVCERRRVVPDVVTAGRDRVGVRVPDHDVARALLDSVSPITATSANRSGGPNASRVVDLDLVIRNAVSVVVDGGETTGSESTVVDVESGTVHRRGAKADEIESWLASN